MAMGNMMGPVLIGPVIAPLVGGALAQQVLPLFSHHQSLLSLLYPQVLPPVLTFPYSTLLFVKNIAP